MSSFEIDYRTGTASARDVYEHLKNCSRDFEPPLEERVDLDEYSRKIVKRAVTFEAWDGSELAGLIAAYFNDLDSRVGFITSVSTATIYKGKGIATELMKKCLDHARRIDFVQIELQVDSNSLHALGLYIKFGFKSDSVDQNTIFMKCDLNRY